MWEQRGCYNTSHPALKEWREEMREMSEPEPEWEALDREEAWETAIRKQPSWKAPGPDKVAAFWLRAFPGVTDLLRGFLWEIMDAERDPPGWLVKGRTVMLPKAGFKGQYGR